MAANDSQYARTPQPSDLTVKNVTGGGTAIASGTCVKFSTAATSLAPTGVVVTTTDDKYYGITVENIPDNGIGRIANFGSEVQAIANAAITAGALVQCDVTGFLKTLTAGKPQVGQAITAAAGAGDKILVRLHSPAVNA